MERLSTALVVGLALAGACRPLHGQTADDSASVHAFYAAWFGPASQDPARYASFSAPDGYVLPPNGQPVRR